MLFISSIFFQIFGYKSYGGFVPFGPVEEITIGTSQFGFGLAGFLVGFGTKLSNGCTSGHGLCGIPRLSLRSFVAVCTFFATGVLTSTIIRNLNISLLLDESSIPINTIDHSQTSTIFTFLGLALPIFGLLYAKLTNPNIHTISLLKDQCIVFTVGLVFAIGLMVAGMSRRSNILNFLNLGGNWNPALLFVFCSGLLFNFITFTIMTKKGTSLNGSKVFNPQNSKIDLQLVLGALLFGLGWGIAGICPGPFFVLFSISTYPIQILWGMGFVIGMILASQVSKLPSKTNVSS